MSSEEIGKGRIMTDNRSGFISRRDVLAGGLAASALASTRAVFASAATDKRFVFIILRGGLDGLSALVPVGDPAYGRLRQKTRISRSDALALDADFALHPSLQGLHGLYKDGQALCLHACATPYRSRSHFDGQDVLENGGTSPMSSEDGWLNRALAGLPGATGLAVGQNLPLILQGEAPATTWSPSVLPEVDEDTIDRLQRLYRGDPVLSASLEQAIATDAMVGDSGMDPATMRERRRDLGGLFAVAAEAAASIMVAPDGPRVAVLQFSGWDTHARQGGVKGALASRLGAMDRAFLALKEKLGAQWDRTVVAVATEFGRTAAENGTLGTDHGTGGAAFLLGGAVRGGRIIADWPGLGASSLLEGRDLRPTMDVRSLLKGVLAEHLGLGRRALDTTVFPDSGNVRPLKGLVV